MKRRRLNVVCVDRYSGRRYPGKRACRGPCEGMGWVPVKADNRNLKLRALWQKAHKAAGRHKCDGWHFVRCPECHGRG